MGAHLSCLVSGLSISDYPSESPLPARPVSHQQLSQRRGLQLEFSNEHGEDVPRYRRQRSGLLEYPTEHGGDDAPRYSCHIAQPQRPRPLLEYSIPHGDHHTPRHRHQTTQSQQFPTSIPASRTPPHHYANGSTPIQARRSHQPPHPRSRSQAPEHENGAGFIRQPQPQRPIRRRPLALEHGDDAGMLRYGRRRPARRQFDSVTLAPPLYEEVVVGREGEFLQGRGEGGEEGPPRYEDRVFDRLVEDE